MSSTISSHSRLWIWIIAGEDSEALARSLANAHGKGQLGVLSLSSLPVQALVPESDALPDYPQNLLWQQGEWSHSVAAAWQQALAASPEGPVLLLEAGETLSPEDWQQLANLPVIPGCGLLTVRRAESLEHAPRLFLDPKAIHLQGDVYPLAAGASLGIGIDASASGMFYHQPDQRQLWLQQLTSHTPQAPDLLYELGQLAFKAQRDLEALERFAALAARSEADFWTLAGRVMELKTRWELHQHPQVHELLDKYRQLDSSIESLPGLWMLRGVMARHFNESDLAMDCFQQARALTEREDFSLNNLVVSLPDITWKPLLGLAEIQLREGLFSQAYINFSKVREYLPGHDYVLTELVKAAFFLRRYDTISEILALGSPLRGLSESTRELLMLMLETGTAVNLHKARLQTLLDKLENEASQISSDPFLVSIMLESAITLLQHNMHAEGRVLLQLLTRWLPNQPVIWHNLAYTYFAAGEYGQAEAYYRRALSVDPDFHDSRFDLAKVLVMQQRQDEAIEELTELKRTQPQDQRVRQALRQLEPDELDAFVPPIQPPQAAVNEAPFIFVFPLSASWANGADIALKAFYQEFVPEDNVILAFPSQADNELISDARLWAEKHFLPELLPPVVLLDEALPLLQAQSAWLLPWRLNPGEAVLSTLANSGYPVLATRMQLSSGQPLPASLTAEDQHHESGTSHNSRRVWLEADLEALQNQMRLTLSSPPQTQTQPGQALKAAGTHDLLALESASEAERINAPPTPEHQQPGLSVCMIVKDEEAMLPACLASIHDQVEEIIVVDTGSSDRSREIAAGFPKVRLFEQPWTGDFAAARNFALEQATQPWIFSLDADETVPADFVATLSLYLSLPNPPDAYAFPILALNPDGSLDQAHSLNCVPRVFANDINYRYRGRIHEMVYNVERQKMRYFYMKQLPIHHRGYQPDILESKQKRLRDTALMEQMVQESPDKPETQRLYLVLAGLYGQDHSPEGLERALSCLEQGLSQVKDDDLIRSMLERSRIQTLLELGRDTDLLDAAGPMISIQDPFIAMYRADALKRLGREDEAYASARSALLLAEQQALNPDPHEQLPKREALLRELARLSESRGDLNSAVYYFKRYLKLDPDKANWKTYETLLQKQRA